MRSHHAIKSSFRRHFGRSGNCLQPLVARNALSHDAHAASNIQSVAILGAGVTGLATAFYLSRLVPPTCQIALFEASPRLGGWLNSTSVDVGKGKVIFESGPRSLRPATLNGLVTLDLIAQLQLQDRIISSPKSSLAARNRYVYYPDHLVRMPGPGASIFENIKTFWSEPVFDGATSEILAEFSKPQRPESVTDESVGSFITRRFGPVIANNLTSAVFHGIYAGDIYKLSARTILPRQWQMEQRYSSIMRSIAESAFGRGLIPITHDDWELLSSRSTQLPQAMTPVDIETTSVYTFAGGLSDLSGRLELELERTPNVHLHRDTAINHIELHKDQPMPEQMSVTTSKSTSREPSSKHTFSHVISTLPSKVLASCVRESGLLRILNDSSAVTVMVVNLFYTDPQIIPVKGFGYLIPRSLPLEQNPEGALGVIFDTDATPGQDNVEGTKVTVILGGHWWSDWDDYPDEDGGARMARKVLERHLNFRDEPSSCNVRLQRECITQYTVGHDDRLGKLSEDLDNIYEGKLRVAGSSYTGVGVNDCIRAARDAAHGLVSGSEVTGLDSFRGGKKWKWISPETSRLR